MGDGGPVPGEGRAASEREAAGRWFALMLAAGALLCGSSLALDLTPDVQRGLGLASTALALLAAGVVHLTRRRIALTSLGRFAVPAVIVQLAAGIHTSGDDANPAAAFFVAAAAYSAFFFAWRVLAAHLLLAGAAYAVALLSLTSFPAALDRWMFTIGMAVLTGGVVARLRLRLVRDARTDWLTRVGNRRAFHERLASELEVSRRAHVPLGLALLDLDGFKALNDRHGHAAGDRALQGLAGLLSERAGADCVARLGGDEFGVILPGADAGAAQRWAAETREVLAASRLPVRASVGVASLAPLAAGKHGPPGDPDALLRAADRALYRAKGTGDGPGGGSGDGAGIRRRSRPRTAV